MQKTPNELIPMLKNAYDTLKDKERDLRLAAEIGKSLLENNMALKSNYQDLLNTPFPTPTNSTTLIKSDDNNNNNNNNTTLLQQEEYEKELSYIPVNRTREALVEILEKQNDDLSLQLEEALLNQDKLDRQNNKKSRQLEKEVQFLQTSLDHATTKIQELEEYRKKKTLTNKDGSSTKLTLHPDGGLTNTTDNETFPPIWIDENDQCVETLSAELESLKHENDQLNQSKLEIEKNLCASLQDLRLLKQQFEQFQFTAEAHERLKQSFETQNLHIQELKQSLEEHRQIFSKLRDRGIHIPSPLTSSASVSSSLENDTGTGSHHNINSDMNKYNLLSELENAWFKHQSSSPTTTATTTTTTTNDTHHTRSRQSSEESNLFEPFQAIYDQLPNVDSALESIILKAGVVEKDALDDALSLIGRLEDEYDHQKFLQEKRHLYYREDYKEDLQIETNINNKSDFSIDEKKGYMYYEEEEEEELVVAGKDHYNYILPVQDKPSGLIGYAKNAIKSMIYMAWRWFRFFIVMTIAIFISIKEGPQ
ncbi:hypothetical protein BD770DRAFT_346037 [Pilaira anomala]|nr:hypothetical protein BD770DRAFT_346037 [Pilaira anomala]